VRREIEGRLEGGGDQIDHTIVVANARWSAGFERFTVDTENFCRL